MPRNLEDSYLFSSMSAAELQEVRALSEALDLPEGAELFRQEQAADRFYFLSAGCIKLSRFSVDGDEKVMELVDEGQTFAEALMFLERPFYPVTAVALQPSQLLAIDNACFIRFLRRSNDLCFRMMGDMSIRLHRLIKEVDDLAMQTATCRVAGYFCGQLAQAQVCRVGKRIEFRLQAPKAVIASRLSIKPETFSRILQNLSKDQVIQVKGGWVKVLDSWALQGLAESVGVCGGSLGPDGRG
jgi:CRP-like cAMP-binding protein